METRLYRQKPEKYVTISNTFLRDNRLTLKAKGMMAVIMSLPDNWDFSIVGIVAVLKESECAVRAAIKELIEYKYCYIRQIRDDKNRIAKWEYYFDGDGFSDDLLFGFPQVENPHVENQRQYNNITNDSSTINSPTKEINNSLSDDKHNIVSDQYDEQFKDFWKQYGKSVDKQGTYKVWCRLSKKDKELAIAMIQPYKENRCHYDKKFMLDPIRYLRRKTWEDDLTPAGRVFYDVLDSDSERVVAFKNWMRSTFPYIDQAVSPLSYDEYMNLIQKYSVDEVGEQLHYINENMVRYKRSTISEEIDFFLKRHREEGAA